MCRRLLPMIVACLALALVPGSGAPAAHADEHGSSTGENEAHGESENHGEADEIDDDHNMARQAVEADEAMSLGRMLAIFGASGDRVVVDIALVRQGQRLQYRIKYIDHEGRVRQTRFDARTGLAVP